MESRISFTMPVALPPTESGLNFVDYSNTTAQDCAVVDDSGGGGGGGGRDPDQLGNSANPQCGRVVKEVYEVRWFYLLAGPLVSWCD